MQKRLGTVIGALASILAVLVAWALWSTRDAGPTDFPPLVEQTDKPATPPPGPPVAERPPPRAESSAGGTVVHEVTDDSAAETLPDGITADMPPAIVAGDFPPYLGAVAYFASTRTDPRGCKSFDRILAEMSEESRDDLWAPRVERELRAMLGRHPWGLQVSVGCRATICQITEVGVITGVDQAEEGDWHRYWGNFMRDLRRSPIASEFATSRFFTGRFPADPTPEISEIPDGYWDIAGFVLTRVGQGTPSEPPDCAPFGPLDSDSPGEITTGDSLGATRPDADA